MGDKSKIEWTDATWNPLRGCSRKSEGCRYCYAEGVAARFSGPGQPYEGLAAFVGAGREPRWTGKVALVEHVLDQPLRWRRPRKIFVNSMSDLFHESVPDEWIDRIFAIMALAPQHTFQILTKRPERMRTYLSAARAHPIALASLERTMVSLSGNPKSNVGSGCILHGDIAHLKVWPLPNVWLGVSVEDQATADERIPLLLDTPAAKRFISAEPLLGRLDIGWALSHNRLDIAAGFLARGHFSPGLETLKPLDLIIVGGESGRRARPMHPDWVRSLRDQCDNAGVPFFFKQWGSWISVYDRDIEDPDWRRIAAVVGETPKGQWLNLAGGQGFHGDRVIRVKRVSKKKSGYLLDGKVYRELPALAA